MGGSLIGWSEKAVMLREGTAPGLLYSAILINDNESWAYLESKTSDLGTNAHMLLSMQASTPKMAKRDNNSAAPIFAKTIESFGKMVAPSFFATSRLT